MHIERMPTREWVSPSTGETLRTERLDAPRVNIWGQVIPPIDIVRRNVRLLKRGGNA